MLSAVRPGGWLVLEEIDIGGIMTAALAHYTHPPEHAALYERITRAIEAAGRATQLIPTSVRGSSGCSPRRGW